MRTTSFFKAAKIAALLGCLAAGLSMAVAAPSGNSLEDVSVISSKTVAVDDATPTQDLGSTEVVTDGEVIQTKNASYTEITSAVWEGKSLSAADLLATLPGIQSYKQGGLGSFQTVSVRGIAARNILICVDGVPLNDASGGAVNLGSIDLNQMEKIEVYKGNVPVKFGVSGIGGAINFVTKNAVKKGCRVLGAYGNHNLWEGSFQVSAPVTDSIMFATTFATRHSDNDYEYLNRNGTQYNDDDDYTATRENAQYTDVSGNVQFRMLHGNGYFSTVAVTASRNESGNPGKEQNQTKVAKFVGESALLRYGLESVGYFDDKLFLYGGVSARIDKNISTSYYPLDHIGFGNNVLMEYGSMTYKFVPEFWAEFTPMERLTGVARVAVEWERAEARGNSKDWALDRKTYVGSGDLYYQFFKYVGVGGEGSAQMLKDHLDKGTFVLPTGGRTLDEAKERDASFAGRLYSRFGASTSPFTGEISMGRFYQQPALMELYGTFPGAISNPDLNREKATRFEATGMYKFSGNHTSFQTTYFESHIEDGICWVLSVELLRPINVSRALIRGVEMELNSSPSKFLDVVLRATIQKTEDRSHSEAFNGNKLSGEPDRSYFAEATLHLPFHFDFSWASDWRSVMYSDRANRTEQPAVATHRANLSYAPFEKTRLAFSVNNITDEKYRNFYTPFPMPGREYKFTIIQGF
ncbi:TonB-dependent receptor [uncultured Fibrobacter sp.]|uniref:TonB-dependent receptor n=1 Tax=uncultured Fibrobacter sp. TaxID=261512 RepID=UPI00263252CF|nr:TonB-dependent receptor plug domain-containing protein [uncultured Fibrobacter sp.]